MSPTQRTLAACREAGWRAQVVEKWNPHARIRQDLFGAIDIVALRGPGEGILGIQATDGTSVSKRVAKALMERTAEIADWLAAGGAFQVWGWAKRGKRGERKLWTLRRVEVVMGADGALDARDVA